MRVRRLDIEDAELLVAIVRDFKARSISSAEARAFLGNSANYVVVAGDDEAIGFLLAHRLDRIDRPSAKMFIYELEVAEGHRRRGIGTALVTTIAAISRQERMMSTFVLTNHSNEAAVALYKKTGGRIVNGDDLMFVYE